MDEKPFGLIVEDTEKQIEQIINNCKLHPTVIRLMLQNILSTVVRAEGSYVAKESEAYNKSATTDDDNKKDEATDNVEVED